ncbi:MAG: aminoglycoside phosphotransferase family protein [Pseudomonadota bacterium]
MLSIDTVRQALHDQAAEYANLELSSSSQISGTDNDIYRLGSNFCVRLPKSQSSAAQLLKEMKWLPRMQGLSLAVPQPVFLGDATPELEFGWTIYNWIEGEDLLRSAPLEQDDIAMQIAQFLKSLWAINPEHGPRAGSQNHYRGADLHMRDSLTREACRMVSDEFCSQSLMRVWESALSSSNFHGPLKWVHGDIHAANLIVNNARLVAIIDWGLMGVGDPAVDLLPAWSLLSSEMRGVLKIETCVDKATWNRGKGWALSVSVIAYSYYKDRQNFWLNDISKRILNELIADADSL